MIVVEAKPSSDPVQEKLRQNKRIWQKEVKMFIDNLINLKRLMGGQPSKFFKQKSTIKDPIPSDPISLIGNLAGDFQEISQKGTAIVQQQIEYSKNRRKKQPKQKMVTESPVMAPTSTPPESGEGVDLTKKLIASIESYELLAESSNPFSRFFARLLNPAIGSSPEARIRKYRMSLLSSSLGVYKDLDKLQKEITGSSPESIFKASKLLAKAEKNWSFFKTGFKTYKDSNGQSTTEGGRITLTDAKIDNIIKDFNTYASFLGVHRRGRLVSAIVKYKKITESGSKASDVANLSGVIDTVIEEYSKLLFELNAKHGLNGKSLKDIYSKIKTMEDNIAGAKWTDLVQTPQGTMPSQSVQVEKPKPATSKIELSDVGTVLSDLKYRSYFSDLDSKDLSKLLGAYRYHKEPGLIPPIMAEYKRLLSQLNSKYNTNGSSFREIMEAKKKKAEASSDRLEAVGQKWLGKLKHQLNPFDKTSAHRLDIYKIADSCRKKINAIMDSLETGLNVDVLESSVVEIDKNLKEMQLLISGLETTVHGKGFDKPFMDLLEKGKITNFGPDLDPKQRERLKKLIEQKRLRELSNIYQGKK